MKSATAERHRDLTGRLIDAAELAIEASGLAAIRARSLAEVAGCSVGAIYGVFPDLDGLVLVVNGRTLDAIEGALGAEGTGAGPGDHLVRLAEAYLGYAAGHRPRWRALFEHRMAEGQEIPAWYGERQEAMFARIEGPLGILRPSLPDASLKRLARSLFSAVHGMVDLGLNAKVAEMPLPVLRDQIGIVVRALAAGLASAGDQSASASDADRDSTASRVAAT